MEFSPGKKCGLVDAYALNLEVYNKDRWWQRTLEIDLQASLPEHLSVDFPLNSHISIK